VVHTEQALRALDGEDLDLVYDLLALVVAAAGVALAVFVAEHRGAGGRDGRTDVVLRRDQGQGRRASALLG